MNNIFKQFAEWVTNLKDKPFLKARLKLTIYYTVGIVVILIIVNLGVYGFFVSDIPETIENKSSAIYEEEIRDRLETIIFTVNGFVILVVIGLSYYFAGKTLKPLEQVFKRQRKFIADAAHELRTPLTVMKTGAETILATSNNKYDYKKLLKDSLEEINFLSSIVDDLLFLAGNDDLKKVEFEKLDLGKLVRQQINLMETYSKKKGVSMLGNIKDEFFINGNKAYIKRLVINLLKNAIDYNNPNGKVNVFINKNKQFIELTIIDTGIGIAQKDLPNIFERFYKVDQARTKQSGGAGLGLSIVKEIVEIHAAQISIESKLNKGTTITILFPLSQRLYS